MFFATEDAEAPYSQQKHDLEFTVAQSMNSLLQILNKVGKTSKPFWYDLNKIPFDYTVEVTNKLKGLDLIDRVPEELWTEVCNIIQEVVIKTIPHKKKCKKVKCLSEEALQIAEKKAKGKGEKE